MSDNAATSTSTNVYRIEPLMGAENYAVWKIKMINILTGQDLWEYVDGTTILPNDAASQLGWRKKDRLALSMIRLRVADKMLVYVASLTSAREAWETLNSLLEGQGVDCPKSGPGQVRPNFFGPGPGPLGPVHNLSGPGPGPQRTRARGAGPGPVRVRTWPHRKFCRPFRYFDGSRPVLLLAMLFQTLHVIAAFNLPQVHSGEKLTPLSNDTSVPVSNFTLV